MNQQLSPRDWEYLSAYLDRQLKPKEVAHLEARLSADPELSAALGELQRTRGALRSLPRLRAPRNFTLTPQMVGQRSPLRSRPAARLAPVFGFASALATFLLVLVIVGDLLGILTPAARPVAEAPALTPEATLQVEITREVEERVAEQSVPILEQASQAEIAAAEEAPVEEAPVEESMQALPEATPMPLTVEDTAPPVIAEDTPTLSEAAVPSLKEAPGIGGGGGGSPDEAWSNLLPPDSILESDRPMWVTTILLTVSPTQTLTFPMTITLEGPAISAEFTAETETGLPAEGLSEAGSPPTVTPEEPALAAQPVEPEPTEAPTIVARLDETPAPSQLETTTLEQEELRPQPTPSPTPSPQPARSGRVGLTLLEISLALLALGTGLAALYTWWSRRL